MQLLTDILVAILTGYLAFTNMLADKLLALAPNDAAPTTLAENTENTPGFSLIPTRFSPSHFTDILRNSAEYQRAAIIESAATVTNPITDPRQAVVNIACMFTSRTTIRSTTGTGFMVHPSGVILTNAHVAQYLLLADTTALGEASCEIKQSIPGAPRYRAALLYLPPAWIQANANLISQEIPMGTGERDYALLYITSTLTNEPLPATFPALTLNSNFLPKSIINDEVQAVGYPAPQRVQPGDNLSVVLATTTISELYTFGSNYADVFSIRGSSVGASGSSGGPVLADDGQVIGMITTRGNDEVDGPGSLRAITISHIHRTIEEETGFSLERNVSGNIALRGEVFKATMSPLLTYLLTSELSP